MYQTEWPHWEEDRDRPMPTHPVLRGHRFLAAMLLVNEYLYSGKKKRTPELLADLALFKKVVIKLLFALIPPAMPKNRVMSYLSSDEVLVVLNYQQGNAG